MSDIEDLRDDLRQAEYEIDTWRAEATKKESEYLELQELYRDLKEELDLVIEQRDDIAEMSDINYSMWTEALLEINELRDRAEKIGADFTQARQAIHELIRHGADLEKRADKAEGLAEGLRYQRNEQRERAERAEALLEDRRYRVADLKASRNMWEERADSAESELNELKAALRTLSQ